MRLKEYDNDDGRKVWLDEHEVDTLLSNVDRTEKKIALGLGVRCGLRAQEIVDVKPADIVDDETVGARVRVREGKGDKYREVPMPRELYSVAIAYADTRDEGHETPLVDRSRRTIVRWVNRAAERCYAETGDDGWVYLGPHDLRRTWGTLLVGEGVEAGMIMEWGGWEDWTTFREHYLGAYSPKMEKEEMEKVGWL